MLDLPYVYTEWKQFTVEDGLPNDHIFAIAVDGPKVWVGTEDGLALLDKQAGTIRSWKEKDGLPWRVVSSLAVNETTGELWIVLFGGGLARLSGGRFDHWHQLNSGLVNDVVYGVAIEHDNYAQTAVDVEPFRGVRPFKEHFLLQVEYTGPGRATPEPEGLDSVKIGFLRPIMSTVSVATGGKSHEEPLGVQMLRGARLAIEDANARGGYVKRGLPFELAISNDNGLWGSSGNEIVQLAYRDKVWAILGTIDGANIHIAIRVALKAELVMMNSGDTDPTFIETNIPWVVRCIGDDRQQGYLLVDYIYRKLGYERVGIIRANNRYGRFSVRELRDGSRRLGHHRLHRRGVDAFGGAGRGQGSSDSRQSSVYRREHPHGARAVDVLVPSRRSSADTRFGRGSR